MESTAGNLVHLEEYVDTIVSLPHEIQRNLTMIREHDSQVQEMEKDLFVDINDFMSLQSGKKEIPGDERIELIKRIKKSFLSTLTHCEEKVSLANQCYNSVERHLIKMEEDLKCFEEEIRLSGYSELLEKVRIERRRQREQVKNKKKQEALMNASENESEDETEAANGENEESFSEKEQQQQQQLKKRKPANRNATTTKKPRATGKPTTKSENSVESDEEAQMAKMSRAERLLRRSKPVYVGEEAANSAAAIERSKEDENQGDDEAEESEEEAEEQEQGGEIEEEEGEIEKEIEGEAKEDPEEEEEEEHQQSQQHEQSQQHQQPHKSQNDLPTRTSRRQSKPSPSTEQLYCTCNRDSFGEMIGCDAKDCPVEWFHYECVGLKSPPKGKWYCKGCQESMDAKTAAQLAVGISTRSSRR